MKKKLIATGLILVILLVPVSCAAPPPPVGNGVPPTYYAEMTLFGIEGRFLISGESKILRTIEATSEDDNLTVTIPRGTVALGKDSKRLKELEAKVDESPPSPPENTSIIELAFDFGPDGAMFSPPIILTWSYNPDTLPANVTEESLILAYYDGNEWIGLVCTVDTENDVITASVSHFTTFAIIGSVLPPPVPAPVPAPAPAPSPAPPPEITVTFPRVSDYCTIDVDYPSEREGNLPVPEGFVTVRKGGAVTLPVTIKSLVDKPIKIRLTLGGVYPPEFVEYEYPKGYMTLNPGETIDTQIIVEASENAQTGDYTSREEAIFVTGYLQEPELGKMFSVFYLSIVD